MDGETWEWIKFFLIVGSIPTSVGFVCGVVTGWGIWG